MQINYKDLIKDTVVIRKDDYINFFFQTIVGTDVKPIYGRENNQNESFFDIAIVKNSQEKKTRVGNKYIERYWRTCIFYFIDREKACEYLNDSNKEQYVFSDNDDIISWNSSNGFANNRINSAYAEKVNNKVFKYFKRKKSSWFVRSYVYFVLIICDDKTPITTKDFYINYWNNNYDFKKGNKSSLFGKSKTISFAQNVSEELDLIKNENKDSIDCVLAYLNKLDFYPENEEAFADIKTDIDSGIEYILCQGAARTGKTILAMRLLHDYSQFQLLLMNYNFYVSLKDAFSVIGVAFPYKRVFHHDLSHKDGCWVDGRIHKTVVMDLKNVIVDEAQRLGFVEERFSNYGIFQSIDEIKEIVSSKNHSQTVFFGDDWQRLNPKYDEGFNAIKELVNGRNYREYYFREPLGVPPEILQNVRFLLSNNGIEPCAPNQFSISIQKEPGAFIDSYFCDEQKKKHLVVPIIGNEGLESVNISGKVFKNLKNGNRQRYLFDGEIQNNYFLNAYSVISREIESVYLYIPKFIYLDENFIIQTRFSNDNSFILNHLYTLMTRATMSLKIYCEDEGLANYLNKKISTINNTLPIEKEPLPTKSDYDVFIAYFGTNSESGTYREAKRICDRIKETGLKVFLLNYSFSEADDDLLFNETWHVLPRSSTLIYVFNEYAKRTQNGLIERKETNGEISRIYQELNSFAELITLGQRTAKHDARFYYVGSRLTKYNVYPFLNKYIQPLTQGNSDCCFMNDDEMFAWINHRFFEDD